MNDKDIERLAREITEAFADDVHLPLCIVKELEEVKFLPKFLNLLLRDHCIVPKSEVIKLAEETNCAIREEDKGCRAWFFYGGMKQCIKSLFGTGLFEERREE